jgi:hypothetical protein
MAGGIPAGVSFAKLFEQIRRDGNRREQEVFDMGRTGFWLSLFKMMVYFVAGVLAFILMTTLLG